ncbi:hypothetical protein Tco_0610675 [Tanacetum coccineum]
MTTLSPSPPISLLPPSAGERLARCTTPPVHLLPLPVPLPLLPSSGCLTQIQTLRIAFTQALIDAAEVRGRGLVRLVKGIRIHDRSAEAIPEVALMTMREVNTRLQKLAELKSVLHRLCMAFIKGCSGW